MKANRITQKLHITIDYIPNNYINKGDDWELCISANNDLSGSHKLSPHGYSMKDLTINELLQEIREVIENELQIKGE